MAHGFGTSVGLTGLNISLDVLVEAWSPIAFADAPNDVVNTWVANKVVVMVGLDEPQSQIFIVRDEDSATHQELARQVKHRTWVIRRDESHLTLHLLVVLSAYSNKGCQYCIVEHQGGEEPARLEEELLLPAAPTLLS